MFLIKLLANLVRRSVPARRDAMAMLAAPRAAAHDGRVEEAIALLEALLAREPDFAEAHVMLGTLLEANKRIDSARAHYLRAAACDPQAWEPPFRLGLLGLETRRYAEGAAQLARAIELGSPDAQMHNALGAAYLLQDRIEEAVEQFTKALALEPEHVHAHSNLGYVLIRDLERYEQGAQHIERAKELAPTDPVVLCNWGMALYHRGRWKEALEVSEALLAHDPTLVEARVNRAVLLLAQGDFERGWPDYEARKVSPRNKYVDDLPLPEWDGSPLAGRTIYVHSEQGIGDEIMFASCLPDLIARGGRCIVEAHPKLETIFRRSFPDARIIAKGSASLLADGTGAAPDVKVAIGSLPLFFRRKAADFARQAPGYLRPDETRVAHWKAQLARLPGRRKVGISWRGGVASTRRSLRSIPLTQWAPILSVAGIDFVSVQYSDPDGELEALRQQGIGVHAWPEAIDDYDETAALVCALDLIVSVQTAVVHLSGGLGRPAWALVPAAPEWRYGVEHDALPWYSSVRLMRQAVLHDWEPVIDRVRTELEAWREGAAQQKPCL